MCSSDLVPRAFSRLRISLAIGGVALAAVAAAGIPSTRAATIPIEKNGVWAQDYSDLKPEADVRFGQLANGMRYALLHNATPVGQVSIRLLDPWGRAVFGPYASWGPDDVDPVTLNWDGAYTLLVEGRYYVEIGRAHV